MTALQYESRASGEDAPNHPPLTGGAREGRADLIELHSIHAGFPIAMLVHYSAPALK
jgi:hypothetical protein